MKTTSRPQPADEPTGLVAGWNRWWFTPSDAFGLHLIRVCTGLLFLAWLLPLAGDVPAQFGIDGWFDVKALNEANRLPVTQLPKPISRWSLVYIAGNNPGTLQAIYWASVAVLGLFTLGIATRLTAPLTWVVVVSYMASPAFDEEVDPVLKLLAFYLAVAYLGMGLRNWAGSSWLERLTGRRDAFLLGRLRNRETDVTSLSATVALRLLQVHVAILLVTTGLHKLQNGAWWEGVPFWYNVYPPLTTTVAKAREHLRDAPYYLSTLNIAAYAVLAWQLTFPLFAWRTGGWWRTLLLGGSAVGWLGLALLYQLPLFGPALVICSLAYVSDREWLTVGGWFERLRSNDHQHPAPHFGSRATVASSQER